MKVYFIIAALFLSGCATNSRVPTTASQSNPNLEVTDGEQVAEDEEADQLRHLPKTEHDIGDKEAAKEVPVEINNLVTKWLDYFQGRGRKHMELYLSRSARYLPAMKSILREQGLPEDLVYVALIESGFSHQAVSHAGAVGYWQFMRGTGKQYGLKINPLVDERRDPLLSTRAAAEYLSGLYNLFGSWYLAIAAYNTGENRVKRLVMVHRSRNFWELARKRGLPKETVNYVPKFLAAKLIAEDPAKYGFSELDYFNALEFEEITADKTVDLKALAKSLNMEYDEIKRLNPMYRTQYAVRVRGEDYKLRVPKGSQSLALQSLQAAYVQNDTKLLQASLRSDTTTFVYRVKRGDTLTKIAKRFGVRLSDIRNSNDLNSKRLRVGQLLRVPNGSVNSRVYAELNRKPAKAKRLTESAKVHVVRRGETLSQIARRYKISISKLAKENNLSARARLYAGAKLEIPRN